MEDLVLRVGQVALGIILGLGLGCVITHPLIAVPVVAISALTISLLGNWKKQKDRNDSMADWESCLEACYEHLHTQVASAARHAAICSFCFSRWGLDAEAPFSRLRSDLNGMVEASIAAVVNDSSHSAWMSHRDYIRSFMIPLINTDYENLAREFARQLVARNFNPFDFFDRVGIPISPPSRRSRCMHMRCNELMRS